MVHLIFVIFNNMPLATSWKKCVEKCIYPNNLQICLGTLYGVAGCRWGWKLQLDNYYACKMNGPAHNAADRRTEKEMQGFNTFSMPYFHILQIIFRWFPLFDLTRQTLPVFCFAYILQNLICSNIICQFMLTIVQGRSLPPWFSVLHLLCPLHFPLMFFATLMDENDLKWKECMKHAVKRRNRLTLQSIYWHVRDFSILYVVGG